MDDKPSELASNNEWLACFQGFPIYVNPNLAPGCAQFRDGDGKIIGHIFASEIHLAPKRS